MKLGGSNFRYIGTEIQMLQSDESDETLKLTRAEVVINPLEGE